MPLLLLTSKNYFSVTARRGKPLKPIENGHQHFKINHGAAAAGVDAEYVIGNDPQSPQTQNDKFIL
jgi:hypothetical protein